jgi:hypothetical protein
MLELAEHIGLSELIDEQVDLPSIRVKSEAVNPASKLNSIIAAMMCGADSIDDSNVLRAGGTPRVLDEVYAPSTLGIFLREFTFGHANQLAAVGRAHLVALAQRVPLPAQHRAARVRGHRLAVAPGLRPPQAGCFVWARQVRQPRCCAVACSTHRSSRCCRRGARTSAARPIPAGGGTPRRDGPRALGTSVQSPGTDLVRPDKAPERVSPRPGSRPLLKDEGDEHVDAVGNNLPILHIHRLLFDPGRLDTTQRLVGPRQASLHGVFETGVGRGADLGDARDGA